MSVLVVTGTSTDVGKTVATAAVAAMIGASGRTVGVCKPVQTGIAPGEDGDLAEVARLSGVETLVELARYPDPLAPDTAARRSGRPMISCSDVVAAVEELAETHDVVLVEGAGGLLVRMGTDGFTVVDVAAGLEAPVAVVAAAGLGTLNHSELTVRALGAAGLSCSGLIVGSWPDEPGLADRCNLDDLPQVTGVPVIGRIPAGSGSLGRAGFVAAAPGWFESNWVDSLAEQAGDERSRVGQ
ncbi:dethiobiotin synthase [Rhodococcus sp. NPDC058521]|uniref:dethiobiotin synthase n=1 Tax=Rhodococcus sp. NPDC058521 TaxID=3346536 RepID=UPI003651DFAB